LVPKEIIVYAPEALTIVGLGSVLEPKAPIIPGPLVVTEALEIEGTEKLSPLLNKILFFVAWYVSIAVAKLEEVRVDAPDGHPAKLPEVDTQSVLVPENTVLGSVTVIVVVVVEVLVPS
jgi:hypothetical protein